MINLIGPHATRCGGEDLIIFTRASVVVVFAMSDSPTVVRDKQHGVADGADHIIGKLAFGKALMTTLVGQYPHSCHHRALSEPV